MTTRPPSWKYKVRFGLSKLPFFPTRYTLTTPGLDDFRFTWARVMPFLEPGRPLFSYHVWGWDAAELRWLRRFLRPGMTFLDIGAYGGLYSIVAAASQADAVAVEPSPRNRKLLRRNLRLNGLSNQVRVIESALGDRIGHVSFEDLGGAGAIRSRVQREEQRHRPSIEVRMTTLDSLLPELPWKRTDCIKVDIEGGEFDLLAGGARVHEQEPRPVWILEAQDAHFEGARSARGLLQRMADLGYQLREFREDGTSEPHELKDSYPHTHLCNYLAVPAGRSVP